jgi:hypothetical protein
MFKTIEDREDELAARHRANSLAMKYGEKGTRSEGLLQRSSTESLVHDIDDKQQALLQQRYKLLQQAFIRKACKIAHVPEKDGNDHQQLADNLRGFRINVACIHELKEHTHHHTSHADAEDRCEWCDAELKSGDPRWGCHKCKNSDGKSFHCCTKCKKLMDWKAAKTGTYTITAHAVPIHDKCNDFDKVQTFHAVKSDSTTEVQPLRRGQEVYVHDVTEVTKDGKIYLRGHVHDETFQWNSGFITLSEGSRTMAEVRESLAESCRRQNKPDINQEYRTIKAKIDDEHVERDELVGLPFFRIIASAFQTSGGALIMPGAFQVTVLCVGALFAAGAAFFLQLQFAFFMPIIIISVTLAFYGFYLLSQRTEKRTLDRGADLKTDQVLSIPFQGQILQLLLYTLCYSVSRLALSPDIWNTPQYRVLAWASLAVFFCIAILMWRVGSDIQMYTVLHLALPPNRKLASLNQDLKNLLDADKKHKERAEETMTELAEQEKIQQEKSHRQRQQTKLL